MSDYIKREDALDACYEETSSKWSTKEEVEEGRIIAGVIRSIPSADVVEVVRCKDCIHRQPVKDCMFGECMYAASMVADDDYCSNGERKGAEDDYTIQP